MVGERTGVGGGEFVCMDALSDLSFSPIMLTCLLFRFMLINYSSNHRRNRGFALEAMDQLEPGLFQRMFRVDRPTFDEIVGRITPFLRQRNERKACNSSGSAITVRTRVAVTLRWLAGASYLDLCFAWGISSGTFYSRRGVLWPTISAMDKAFSMGFPRDDPERLELLAAGFRRHSGGVMDGCVLAVDGFGVTVRCPFKNDVERRKDYRFRKGGFAIIVLAGCDIDGRFISATASHSGSTNDIIAWQDSQLRYFLEEERGLPSKYFFIGDEAFTNTQQFLSPWPGRGLDRYKDSFNYWLSHSRQCVERSFGMLTKRFGIFWRPFQFAFDRWSTVVLVCMKLHNLCLDRNLEIPSHRFMEDVQENDQWVVYDNYRDDDAALRGYPRGDRRRDMTYKLEQLGITRPIHAEVNSRCN